MSKEMKMSDVFELPVNTVAMGICNDQVKKEYDDGVTPWDCIDVAINNHDRLVEENAKLTELAAQKASRADELYEALLWVHQRLMLDSGRYSESTQCSVVVKLLDKIKLESK